MHILERNSDDLQQLTSHMSNLIWDNDLVLLKTNKQEVYIKQQNQV